MIPLHGPLLDALDAEGVIACLDPERFRGDGPVRAFEQAFADAIGSPQSIGLANGTVALHLALLAAGVGPGDEVLVPSLTFIATANAVRYVGATPVFVDVDPCTWQIDPADAVAAITPRTKAVIAVHLYGRACDLGALAALRRDHGLLLIEDCAEALGTSYEGTHVGMTADAATFSFYKNKTITTGEGGALVTRHPDWHDRIVLLKGQGVPLDRRHWHAVLGYNYRMAPLSAALGLAQLTKLPSILGRKRAIALRYHDQLHETSMVFQQDAARASSTCWLVAARLPDTSTRDGLLDHLAEHGIESRAVFLPLQHFPMYATLSRATPHAELIAGDGICLPSGPALCDADVDRVCNCVRDFLRRDRR